MNIRGVVVRRCTVKNDHADMMRRLIAVRRDHATAKRPVRCFDGSRHRAKAEFRVIQRRSVAGILSDDRAKIANRLGGQDSIITARMVGLAKAIERLRCLQAASRRGRIAVADKIRRNSLHVT